MGQRLIDWPRSRAIERGGSGAGWPRVEPAKGRIEAAAVPPSTAWCRAEQVRAVVHCSWRSGTVSAGLEWWAQK
jgi:hypothetical protein